MSDEQRAAHFDSRLNKTDPKGCWLWTGAVGGANHYGSLRFNKKSHRAHVYAWTVRYGPVPAGLCVLHRCDVPLCCNPEHLFLGTKKQNSEDMVAKGRSAAGERQNFAKLTWSAVEDIRRQYAARARQIDLARHFQVGESTIHKVVHGQNWKERERNIA